MHVMDHIAYPEVADGSVLCERLYTRGYQLKQNNVTQL
jgi:hypothetical protein